MRSQPAAPAPAYHIFNYGFSAWGAAFSRSAATHKVRWGACSELCLHTYLHTYLHILYLNTYR